MRLLKLLNNNRLSGAIVRAGLAALALPLAIAALLAGFCQAAQETEKMKTGMEISLAVASMKFEDVFSGAENGAASVDLEALQGELSGCLAERGGLVFVYAVGGELLAAWAESSAEAELAAIGAELVAAEAEPVAEAELVVGGGPDAEAELVAEAELAAAEAEPVAEAELVVGGEPDAKAELVAGAEPVVGTEPVAEAGLAVTQGRGRGDMLESAGVGTGAGEAVFAFAEIAGRGGKWLRAHVRAPSGRVYAYMLPKRLLTEKIAGAAALVGAVLIALLLIGAAVLVAMSRRIIKPIANLVGQSRELLSGQQLRGECEGENAAAAPGAPAAPPFGAGADVGADGITDVGANGNTGGNADADAAVGADAGAGAARARAGVSAAARRARRAGSARADGGAGADGGFAGASDEISYLQRAFDSMAQRLAGLRSRTESMEPLLRELALQSIAEGFADGCGAAARADLIGFSENAAYVALAVQVEACGGERATVGDDSGAGDERAAASASASAGDERATVSASADAGYKWAAASASAGAGAGKEWAAVSASAGDERAAIGAARQNALEAVRAGIAELIGAAARAGGAAYAVPALGQCRALLCCGAVARDGEAAQMAASLAQELRDFGIRERIPLAVGIGSPARSLADCRRSCREAQAALKNRLAAEGGQAAGAFEAAPARRAAGRPFPTEISDQIVRALNEPDLELARKQLGLFCKFVRASRSYRFVFQSFNILLARVIVAHQERGGASPGLLDADCFERLSLIPSPDGMESWFAGSMFPLYLSFGDARIKSDGKAAIHRMVRYISENVSGDLSLVRCADLAGINPSYASRMFKDETGYSFLEYVVKIRIDKAKEMLRHTTVSVANIAEAIGYSNRSMYRIFYKETGMSPNEFRVLCQ